MADLKDLSVELILWIIHFGDPKLIPTLREVSWHFYKIMKGTRPQYYEVLHRIGMRDCGDASPLTLDERLRLARAYLQALYHPRRFSQPNTVFAGLRRTRHIYVHGELAFAVQNHMIHLHDIGIPIRGKPHRRITPAEGIPVIPEGVLETVGLTPANVFLETVALDVERECFVVVFLTAPASDWT